MIGRLNEGRDEMICLPFLSLNSIHHPKQVTKQILHVDDHTQSTIRREFENRFLKQVVFEKTDNGSKKE